MSTSELDNSSIPAKRFLDSCPSSSPRIKRASTNELEDSSDEVALEASHLNIIDSPSPVAPAFPSPNGMIANDQNEETPVPSYRDGNQPVDTIDGDSRPSGADQLRTINLLRDVGLIRGDSWHLISRSWFRRWQTVSSGVAESKEDDLELSVDSLGRIDNSDIADDAGQLKKSMFIDVNVVALPDDAYSLLGQWYGAPEQVFQRSVVSTAAFGSERIEFYPPRFYPYKIINDTTSSTRLPPYDSVPAVPFSSIATVVHVKIMLSHIVEASRPIRLWRLPMDYNDGGLTYIMADSLAGVAEPIETGVVLETTPINEAMLDDDVNNIAIEEQGIDGKWLDLSTGVAPLFGANKFMAAQTTSVVTNNLTPRYKAGAASMAVPPNNTSGFMSSITNGFGMGTRAKSQSRSLQAGLVGLQNLGNTCFMNSALQCMSNTKELQEYFTSGVYKTELNPDNPLGMNGQVAEAFGQLIQRMWSRSNSGAVAPREFKQALSKFAPSFSGYGQQDSQELLAFLLDGIHEDLNRIKKKPGTNAPDWNGGGDQELVDMARVCWEQYRSRNNSVIVDLFQGQYRSTVVCPDCSKVSITFDPFMYVTTNLPVTKKWTGEVVFVAADPDKPRIRLILEHPRTGTIKSLKIAVGELVQCDPKLLYLIEEWSHKPWKTWTDDEQIIEVKENDALVFHEISFPVAQLKQRFYGKNKPPPPAPVSAEPAPVIIPVVHSAFIKQPFVRKFTSFKSAPDLFGSVFVLSLTPDEAASIDSVYRALITRYASVSPRGAEMLETLSDALDQDVLLEDAAEANPTPSLVSVDQIDEPVASTSTLDPALLPPSPPAESRSTPKPRAPKPLFVIKVSNITASRVPTAADAYSKDTVLLETRLQRSPSPTFDIFPNATSTSLPGSFELPEHATPAPISSSMDKGKETASSDNVEIEFTSPARASLIRIGDFIQTEWAPGALEYYFGEDGKLGWGDLTELVDPEIVAAKDRKVKKKSISIVDCLAEFTKEERLGEDDTWYCPDCKKHQQATKKVEIWKVPDVLVFNLKRFSASRYSRDKVEDLVEFPIEGFSLEPFVEGDKVEHRLALAKGEGNYDEPDSLVYDLYAVDNHYGGLGGGHYTAYAMNHESGKWYDYDDSRVSEISSDRIVTKAAYLLFYRRRTTRPIGAKTRELIESALQSRAASLANSDAGASPPRSPESFHGLTNGFGRSSRGTIPHMDEEELESEMSGFMGERQPLDTSEDYYDSQRFPSRHILPDSRSDSHSRRFNNNEYSQWPLASRSGSDMDVLSDTEADNGDTESRDGDEVYDQSRGAQFPVSSQYVNDHEEGEELPVSHSIRSSGYTASGSPSWPDQDDDGDVVNDAVRVHQVDEDYDVGQVSQVEDIVVDDLTTASGGNLYTLD